MTQELRQSMRMPPQEGHDQATVRIGRSEWMARVVNESAGGMEVDLDGFPELGVGARVVVRIHSGWYELSVVRIEIADETTRLGLIRISSLPELESLGADAWRRHNRKGGPFAPSSRFGSGSVIALCIGFGMLLPQLINGAFDSVFGMDHSKPVPAIPSLDFTTPDSSANTLIYSLSSLTSPDVVQSLGLSSRQQSKIGQIYAETSHTLAKLHQQSASMPSQVLQRESAKAVERAMLRVLRLLDDKQVNEWVDSLQVDPVLIRST